MKKIVGILKSAVVIGIIVVGVMASVKDVKAATDCGCGKHEYEKSGDTITIKNKSGNTDYITSSCNIKAQITSTYNNVIISYGVTGLDYIAFKDCAALKNIEIPDSVVYINYNVFENCTSLKKIELPDSVTYFGNYVFEGCTALESIKLPDNSSFNIGYGTFRGCKSLKSIEIKNKNTEIRGEAFVGCSSLESITFPSDYAKDFNYLNANRGAFFECTSLKSITIPASVSNMDNLFTGGTRLEKIIVKGSGDVIKNSAFTHPESVKSITFDNVISDGNTDSLNGFSPETIVLNGSYYNAGPAGGVGGAPDVIFTTKDSIKNVFEIGKMGTSNLKELVVPDERYDEVLTMISRLSDSDAAKKSKLKSVLKKKSVYDAENSPKSSSSEDKKEEQETASEGTPTGSSKSVYEEKMDSLIKDISAANTDAKKSSDGKKTVYLKDVTALSLDTMKALKSNPNVILDMTYTYKGIAFHVVIPGTSVVYDESIPWYGPVWLYAYYGQGNVTNTANANIRVYIVQKGDTLRKIAVKLSVTLEELLSKNPQIKNMDKLAIGDKIYY